MLRARICYRSFIAQGLNFGGGGYTTVLQTRYSRGEPGRAAMGQMNLSARGYHRVLKLARTIADLAECDQIQAAYLPEAL
jgi:predicted ATPase with chaperone activity